MNMVILIFSSALVVAGALVLELVPVLEVAVLDGVSVLPQPANATEKIITINKAIGKTFRKSFILLPP
jgi:hypothetical protein